MARGFDPDGSPVSDGGSVPPVVPGDAGPAPSQEISRLKSLIAPSHPSITTP